MVVLEKAPITRATLALFAGASNDHNPVHIDIDCARAAGMPDVFAHGMLCMAYLGQALTRWVPQDAVRQFGVRFCAMTHVGDAVRCGATVAGMERTGDENRVRLTLTVINQRGETMLTGEAVVALR